MSDVREELAKLISGAVDPTPSPVGWCKADAILERFDVTEKPVVTAEELGAMVSKAAGGHTGFAVTVGQKMVDQLTEAGLTIVRSGEAAR